MPPGRPPEPGDDGDDEGDEDDETSDESDEKAAAGSPRDPYAAAADSWAASQDDGPVTGEQDAARRLYDLALSFQERSQRSEADLVERFQVAAGRFSAELGELLVVESDEERLVLQAGGTFKAEVEAEDDEDAHAGEATPAGEWLVLATPEELVGFYDPDRRVRRSRRCAGRGIPDDRAASDRRQLCRRAQWRGRGQRSRVSMQLVAAELVESREILPGQWLQAFHAPALTVGSRAGQFVHIRPGDFSGLILRRPFSFNTVDRASGQITIHYRAVGRGTDWFTRLRPGDSVDMLGPLGQPFEVDPRSRHLLLIAGGLGIAGVRMLADDALRAGREVTLLFGAAGATEVYPSSLLPDEVEYVVATDDGSVGHKGYVTELVRDYEGWADQAFACGPAPMLAALARLAAGRGSRLGVASLGAKPKRGGRAGSSSKTVEPGSPAARRRAFLQVSMEQNMGCAVGACLGCVVMDTHGAPQRVCREGPVFASDELDWESGW